MEDAHPHRFRHNFATNLHKQGAKLHYIQLALGHAKIDTTLIYIDDDMEMICEELKRYA